MAEIDQSVASPSAERDDPEGRVSLRSAAESTDDVLLSLTEKQRAVLDLLIEHKTSKEISRLLGISHHTVDQRIMLARAKLGVASRSEVAQAYRRLVANSIANSIADSAIYERSVYDFSDVAPSLDVPHFSVREHEMERSYSSAARRGLPENGVSKGGLRLANPYHRVLPEMFDGPYGTIVRLGTIVVFAMVLIFVILGGLAMFSQLSRLLDH